MKLLALDRPVVGRGPAHAGNTEPSDVPVRPGPGLVDAGLIRGAGGGRLDAGAHLAEFCWAGPELEFADGTVEAGTELGESEITERDLVDIYPIVAEWLVVGRSQPTKTLVNGLILQQLLLLLLGKRRLRLAGWLV